MSIIYKLITNLPFFSKTDFENLQNAAKSKTTSRLITTIIHKYNIYIIIAKI